MDSRITGGNVAEESVKPVVLLAEDEDGVRRAVKRMLELGGYEVIEAALPADALDFAKRKSQRIDALLTDLVMPGMGGLELGVRVSALRPRTAIVLMTGHSEFEGADGGAGALDAPLLRKPFTSADLLAALSTARARAFDRSLP